MHRPSLIYTSIVLDAPAAGAADAALGSAAEAPVMRARNISFRQSFRNKLFAL